MITCINHVDIEDVENESGIFLCEADGREHIEVRDTVHHVQVQTGPLHETTQFQLQINDLFKFFILWQFKPFIFEGN